MPRKPKFRPLITRVKLNPEQAVLQCSCIDDESSGGIDITGATYCAGKGSYGDACNIHWSTASS